MRRNPGINSQWTEDRKSQRTKLKVQSSKFKDGIPFRDKFRKTDSNFELCSLNFELCK